MEKSSLHYHVDSATKTKFRCYFYSIDIVKIDVFNTQGQNVKTLVNGFQSAGSHEAVFDGSRLASGVYY
ncbi:MAG: hypothetical protein OQJ81_08835, partial [Melioribacteraceae bacterium]|nr:hypothetical protein [Melioribacteraceae bacterium]